MHKFMHVNIIFGCLANYYAAQMSETHSVLVQVNSLPKPAI